ncbi:LxmA leader domain family RiPP [Streptomyces sp. NPDC048506]|uniref:LxmA leader domain family RiPP n=1 Tax=Streptomyces sp. NPDC048506 TaxID=3155028 RepID=UPI003427DF40
MDEKLIAGYTAYTTADEYGTAATGDAPATTPALTTISWAITGAGLGSVAMSLRP